jgi:hypothetical protein
VSRKGRHGSRMSRAGLSMCGENGSGEARKTLPTPLAEKVTAMSAGKFVSRRITDDH